MNSGGGRRKGILRLWFCWTRLGRLVEGHGQYEKGHCPGLGGVVGLDDRVASLTFVRMRRFHRWTKCLHRSLAGCPTICRPTSCLRHQHRIAPQLILTSTTAAPHRTLTHSPGHPWHLVPIKHILKRLVQRRVLRHPFIRIILASPDRPVRTVGGSVVLVREDVLGRVPPAVTQIKTAHERDGLVDDAEFLVLPRGLAAVLPSQKAGSGGSLTWDQ